MTKTVDSEPPKTEPEFMPILHWEDDGGSTFERDQPIDPPSGGDKQPPVDGCDRE